VGRYEIYSIKNEVSFIGTYQSWPLGIEWPVKDRSYDTTSTYTIDGEKNSLVVSIHQTIEPHYLTFYI